MGARGFGHLRPERLDHGAPDDGEGENRLGVSVPANAQFPDAFGKGTEDRCIAHGTGEPSLPDGGMGSPPFVRRRPNLELLAVQDGVGIDDGCPHPFSDVNDDRALAGTWWLLGDSVAVMVAGHVRHEATLGALYPLWGTPRYGKLGR
jgi:hypothetical protein